MRKFSNLLKEYYDRYECMKTRYPKAAKKKRVLNKWYNRFGGGLSEMILNPTPKFFVDFLPKNDFVGGSFKVPFGQDAGEKKT